MTSPDSDDTDMDELRHSAAHVDDGSICDGEPRRAWRARCSSQSEQRYEPLGNGVIRFRAGDFTADIRFDGDGFVVDYPGLAKRV
jgi:hypothetical protein